MRRCWLILVFFFAVVDSTQGQPASVQKEAANLAAEGEKLFKEGQYKEAVSYFSRSNQLHPDQPEVVINLAEAHFLLKDYKACESVLQSMVRSKNPPVEAYQLMGNCKDEQGNPKSALMWYQNGLEKYPSSGKLYMEMGISEFVRGHDTQALVHWEKGMQVEPVFSGNYYLAAKLLFDKRDYAWASLYAETVIHLERKGDKVQEMSKMLFQCFEMARNAQGDNTGQWHFEGPDRVGDFHFAMNEAYAGATMDSSAILTLANLEPARRYAAFFIPQKSMTPLADRLFLWQQKAAEEGHFQAYHFWLFYDADPDAFQAWYKGHVAEYEAFEKWYFKYPYIDRLR